MTSKTQPTLASIAKDPELLAELDDEALVAFLGQLADKLDEATAMVDKLYALRLATFQQARDRSPAVTQKRLAEAARITEPAVIQQLRKARAGA